MAEDNQGPKGEDNDQMDWLGGKLAQLIEEGKMALGKEVLVLSNAKEDEVNDGLVHGLVMRSLGFLAA